MPKETLNYTNGEVTVVWQPKRCIHSTLCWKGLIEVFNPRERPWIKMNGASAERIIEQVKKCPSGALGYFANSNENSREEKIISESAAILESRSNH